MNISELMREAGIEPDDEIPKALLKLFTHPYFRETTKSMLLDDNVARRTRRLDAFRQIIEQSSRRRAPKSENYARPLKVDTGWPTALAVLKLGLPRGHHHPSVKTDPPSRTRSNLTANRLRGEINAMDGLCQQLLQSQTSAIVKMQSWSEQLKHHAPTLSATREYPRAGPPTSLQIGLHDILGICSRWHKVQKRAVEPSAWEISTQRLHSLVSRYSSVRSLHLLLKARIMRFHRSSSISGVSIEGKQRDDFATLLMTRQRAVGALELMGEIRVQRAQRSGFRFELRDPEMKVIKRALSMKGLSSSRAAVWTCKNEAVFRAWLNLISNQTSIMKSALLKPKLDHLLQGFRASRFLIAPKRGVEPNKAIEQGVSHDMHKLRDVLVEVRRKLGQLLAMKSRANLPDRLFSRLRELNSLFAHTDKNARAQHWTRLVFPCFSLPPGDHAIRDAHPESHHLKKILCTKLDRSERALAVTKHIRQNERTIAALQPMNCNIAQLTSRMELLVEFLLSRAHLHLRSPQKSILHRSSQLTCKMLGLKRILFALHVNRLNSYQVFWRKNTRDFRFLVLLRKTSSQRQILRTLSENVCATLRAISSAKLKLNSSENRTAAAIHACHNSRNNLEKLVQLSLRGDRKRACDIQPYKARHPVIKLRDELWGSSITQFIATKKHYTSAVDLQPKDLNALRNILCALAQLEHRSREKSLEAFVSIQRLTTRSHLLNSATRHILDLNSAFPEKLAAYRNFADLSLRMSIAWRALLTSTNPTLSEEKKLPGTWKNLRKKTKDLETFNQLCRLGRIQQLNNLQRLGHEVRRLNQREGVNYLGLMDVGALSIHHISHRQLANPDDASHMRYRGPKSIHDALRIVSSRLARFSSDKVLVEKLALMVSLLRQLLISSSTISRRTSQKNRASLDILFELCDSWKSVVMQQNRRLCHIYKNVKSALAQNPDDPELVKLAQAILVGESDAPIGNANVLVPIQRVNEAERRAKTRKHRSRTSPCFVS